MENENLKKQPSSSTSYCCISHVFHQIASNNPRKTAIIQPRKTPKKVFNEKTKVSIFNVNPQVNEGEKFITFSELLSAIDNLTFKLHRIINGGDDPSLIKPNSGNFNFNNNSTKLLGVYMVPSVEYVITVLSILKCGMSFLPLDPFWPKERILSIISSSNVNLVIGCLNFGKEFSTHFTNLIDESHWLVNCCNFGVLRVSFDEILEQKCGKFDLVWPCESEGKREFSYLMYTSGSSGKPKGVCGTEEGVLNRFLWMQEFYPIKEDDVMLFKTSISFVDHLQEFLAPMLVGCTLVVPPFDELKGNLFGIVDYMYGYSITRITAVPSLMRAILPVLESWFSEEVMSSLKLLVLSGEVFPMSLWKMLSRVFPRTRILNIYGSTEVSGDCTCFDCESLPKLLDCEMMSSVPIGKPISNCEVKLIEKDGACDEGEICVTGLCLSRGYYSEGDIIPLSDEGMREESVSVYGCLRSRPYYRTGDFGRRLPSGDLVFCGRKDRIIKINGQRIALEEVEDTLRGHTDIENAAVVFCSELDDHAFLGAVVVLKDKSKSSKILGALKNWIKDRLPSVMIPKKILCTEAIPMSSTGKVNYTLISTNFASVDVPQIDHVDYSKTLEHIKDAFCNSLGVSEVDDDDNFFSMGGDSLIAAHAAHELGIDMRLLYMFPSPSQLHTALIGKEGLLGTDRLIKWETFPKARKEDLPHSSNYKLVRKHEETIWTDSDERGKNKSLKVDNADLHSNDKIVTSLSFSIPWESYSISYKCAISLSNKFLHSSNFELNYKLPETREFKLPRNSEGSLKEIWKVPLDSCVDASPLVIFKDNQIYVFIGSHSHKFLCVDGRNGSIRWEIKLAGRIECSAMIDGDFSQVVVGCYQGKIYFIDVMKGNINWTFQTGGDVKSQPTVDKCRHLIWCGSHDQNLYGLDYRNYRCVYHIPCKGSVFGSPAIDEARNMLYVGTTNGNLTAVTLRDSAFSIVWMLNLEAPIFGSVCISSNGNVLCCLVSGDVILLNPEGAIVWRVKTNGPIFAGPCISKVYASQVLICSRNGNVYSLKLENGRILWKYNTGDPITSSAYIDENIKLISDSCSSSERLVCICTCSGRINVLQVCVHDEDNMPEDVVKKFAEIELSGDIFSSPIMVNGRIFVGCRDDYMHCIAIEANLDN